MNVHWSLKFLVIIVPLLTLVFLLGFIGVMWWYLNKRPKIEDKSTTELSERIYKNFEFFIKVFLALVGAFGFVKLTHTASGLAYVGQRALWFIGTIGMLTMIALVISVASIQGWKFCRWTTVNWWYIWTWQEIYMILVMWLLASGLWLAAFFW